MFYFVFRKQEVKTYLNCNAISYFEHILKSRSHFKTMSNRLCLFFLITDQSLLGLEAKKM